MSEAMIGVSGWQYPDFSERFYPKDLKKTQQLGYYAEHFSTVEINNSFYQLPKEKNIENWYTLVPEDFIFAVKASRYITHMKNLLEPEETLLNFYNRIELFQGKCGPILYQLPPHWEVDIKRLENFLPHLNKEFQHTIEFRNQSWLTEKVYDLLHQHEVAFCIYDFNYYQSPILTTANFVYIRLHGPGRAYHDPYNLESLNRWGDRIQDWVAEGLDVFCYFDNIHRGSAWENAQTLISLL